LLDGRHLANVLRKAIRRAFDGVEVFFEQLEAQQAIVIRRLLVRRNTQPLVIWIKPARHHYPLSKRSGSDCFSRRIRRNPMKNQNADGSLNFSLCAARRERFGLL
jgi:hypothetical protein